MVDIMVPIKQEPVASFASDNLTNIQSLLPGQYLKSRNSLQENLNDIHSRMQSMSPVEHMHQSAGSNCGGGASENELNPQLNLEYLRGLTEKKAVRSECQNLRWHRVLL